MNQAETKWWDEFIVRCEAYRTTDKGMTDDSLVWHRLCEWVDRALDHGKFRRRHAKET